MLHKSYDNPNIKKLYQEFLGKLLSGKSHHLLYTHYEHKPK